ncbi:MAG: metal-sulfur cluster assembly factor [Caldilineales bacterium]
MSDQTEQRLWQALRKVIEPDLGENIVDLGLVRSVRVRDDARATIDITTTTRYSPFADQAADEIRRAAASVGVSQIDVRLTAEPAWTPYHMAEHLRTLLGLPDSEPALPATAATDAWRDRIRRWLFRA